MKPFKFSLASSVCTTSILSVCLVCGCNSTSAVRQHPDEIDSVNNALAFNGLSNVKVWQNRIKGVMTLTGAVASPGEKAQAANIASVNASGYSIANDIAVTPPAGQVKPASDSQIKDKYQAMLRRTRISIVRISTIRSITEPSFFQAEYIALQNEWKP